MTASDEPPTDRARDQLFARPQDLVDFRFDAEVVDVFPDMIQRSVPGYQLAISLSAWLASRHVRAHDVCYDLGCSLLASSLSLAHWCGARSPHIIAVDNSAQMIARARELLDHLPAPRPDIEIREQDIERVEIADAAAVLMNFTLQFLAPGERTRLLARICAGLRPSGALVISEKLAFTDPGEQRYFESAHLDFKRANGYSELEIEQKRNLLEDVMRPQSEERLREELAASGFGTVYVWFRCLNWISVVALP